MIKNEKILEAIIQGMSEGVIIIGLNGCVKYSNPAATAILDVSSEKLASRKLVSVFYKYQENEQFNQTIIEALVNPDRKNIDLVPYYTGTEFRQLHVMTSILWLEGSRYGIIMMISDVTELASLRIRYTQQISTLLDSLVKAFSTAVDGRSHYTANHTRNMVKLADAFLDWLEETDSPVKFDERSRKAFQMSVWLHDVGKLTIPIEVMDKATRLGKHLDAVEQRLDRIHLLEKIALLEGAIDSADYQEREQKRRDLLANIHRINTAGFLKDEDLAYIAEAAQLCYLEEDGSRQQVLTDEEVKCLQIPRGTLTKEERTVMQSHAQMTRKILETVRFPDDFASVPVWASAHHEMLNGRGYPDHRQKETIPVAVRLLTILDIFEALTAADRPYKQPVPVERSLKILQNMGDEGSIDAEILALFIQSKAWEKI